MARQGLTVDEVMAILPETPRRIADHTAGLSQVQLQTAPDAGAWSINVILAHLRACHDVLGGNILRIASEDHPSWKRLSPRAWMTKTDYPTWAFEPAFAAFRQQRQALLAVLDRVSPRDWERTATVQEYGSDVERSMLFFGDWLAGHELVHLTQLDETAAQVRA